MEGQGPKKSRGQRAGKQTDPAAKRVGRQVTLSPEAWRWLEVHALGRRCSISQLIEQWVGQQPSEYVLTKRGTRATAEASAEEPTAPPALGIVREAV